MTTALRSFLSWARYRGDVSIDLAACVPSVANWSLSTVPRACRAGKASGRADVLQPEDSCRPTELRNTVATRAIRLRASEVVRLTLEDLDWQAGLITVLGKGGRHCNRHCPVMSGSHRRLSGETHDQPLPECVSPWSGTDHRLPRVASNSLCRQTGSGTGRNYSPRKGAHQFRHCFRDASVRSYLCLRSEPVTPNPQPRPCQGRPVDLASLRALALPWPECTMSTLRVAVQDYLEMRRSLGFKLHDAGIGLRKFVSFLERQNASHITVALAIQWAQESSSVQPYRMGASTGVSCVRVRLATERNRSAH